MRNEALQQWPVKGGGLAAYPAESVILDGAATTGSAVEIEEGGELMTVATTAVCSARIILTSRASS